MNEERVLGNREEGGPSELGIRLRDLLNGPWAMEGKKAHDYLRPRKPLRNLYRSRQPIDMEHFYKTLPAREKRRTGKISRRLRLHWKGDPVTEDEIPLRDSFDEALTVLQLLELAVETGYLTVEAVWVPSRKYIIEMLWSPGAQRFVRGYDYFLVERLAARVLLPLGKGVVPDLPPAQTAPARFATFLSFHESWYENDELDWWLGLLDDYVQVDDVEGLEVEEWDETEAFERYLKKRELPNQDILDAMAEVNKRFQQRTAGAYWFISRLGGFLGMLTADEMPIYGSFYAYWLAKLFGYDLRNRGYEKVDNGWQSDFLQYVKETGTARSELKILEGQVQLLKTAFLQVNVALSNWKKKQQAKRKRR